MAEVVSLAAAHRQRHGHEPGEEMVDKKELARVFSVSTRTVERWIGRGCPVALRLYGSGPPRFYVSAIKAWHRG